MNLRDRIEALLTEANLRSKVPYNEDEQEESILQDLRNVIYDRKTFLEQRNENLRYHLIVSQLRLHGLKFNADDSPEEIGRAYGERFAEVRGENTMLRARLLRMKNFKKALKELLED